MEISSGSLKHDTCELTVLCCGGAAMLTWMIFDLSYSPAHHYTCIIRRKTRVIVQVRLVFPVDMLSRLQAFSSHVAVATPNIYRRCSRAIMTQNWTHSE